MREKREKLMIGLSLLKIVKSKFFWGGKQTRVAFGDGNFLGKLNQTKLQFFSWLLVLARVLTCDRVSRNHDLHQYD